MALVAGTPLGVYEVVSLLGQGGMDDVYHARDTRLDRVVAIKVLREHLAAEPDRRARFDREAWAISNDACRKQGDLSLGGLRCCIRSFVVACRLLFDYSIDKQIDVFRECLEDRHALLRIR